MTTPASDSIIYFIGDSRRGGAVKIGHTSRERLARRFSKLQTGNPSELRLLAIHPGTRADECALHKRFREFRIRGEWFRWTQELWDYIAPVLVQYGEPPAPRRRRSVV